MQNQLGYDARQVGSQNAQKIAQRGLLMIYDGIKWVVNFIGQLIKTALSK